MSTTASMPPMGASHKIEAALQQRFELHRHMATTALLDIYWATDRQQQSLMATGSEKSIVLLLVINTHISQLPHFHTMWQQYLINPAPTADAYPHIEAFGHSQDVYWMTCKNIQGSLLSEILDELERPGVNPDQALQYAEQASQAISSIQAGAFAYMEPGALLDTEQGYIVLNAPIARIVHSLLKQQTQQSQALALHSAYISPSAAVGDQPLSEDDTFSTASLLYHCLTGRAPYSTKGTLTAAVRGNRPTPTKKLRKESWEILNQALSLQRSQRPETPATLLKKVRKNNRRKLLFPIAVSIAGGILIYAAYHLSQKMDELMAAYPLPQKASQATEVATTPAVKATKQPSSDKTATTSEINAKTTKQEAIDKNQSITDADTSSDERIEQLLAEADQYLLGNSVSSETSEDNDSAQAIVKLRNAWALDNENVETQKRLQQLLEQHTQQIETLMAEGELEQARTTLQTSRRWLKEFALTEYVDPLLTLETQLDKLETQQQDQQRIATWLDDTRQAMQQGQLVQRDAEEDYALAHLNRVLFFDPKHEQGLKMMLQLVQKIQVASQTQLGQQNLEAANEYMLEAERLIRKHQLEEAQFTQAQLQNDYVRARTDQQLAKDKADMSTATTASTAPRVSGNTNNSDTPAIWDEPPEQTETVVNDWQPTMLPDAAPASTQEEPSSQADYVDPFGPNVAEESFAVPPAISPYGNAPTPPARNAQQASSVPEVDPWQTPAQQAAPRSNQQNDQQNGLIEVPLEFIDSGLPADQRR